jgi:hypothetical protein
VQVLRWVRSYYLRILPLTLVAVAMLLVWDEQTWVFAVLALCALIWLQGMASLSLRIRREERRARD